MLIWTREGQIKANLSLQMKWFQIQILVVKMERIEASWSIVDIVFDSLSFALSLAHSDFLKILLTHSFIFSFVGVRKVDVMGWVGIFGICQKLFNFEVAVFVKKGRQICVFFQFSARFPDLKRSNFSNLNDKIQLLRVGAKARGEQYLSSSNSVTRCLYYF